MGKTDYGVIMFKIPLPALLFFLVFSAPGTAAAMTLEEFRTLQKSFWDQKISFAAYFNEAMAGLDEWEGSPKEKFEILRNFARNFANKKQYELAISMVEKLKEEFPERYFVTLYEIYSQQGDDAKALESALNGLREFPDSSSLHSAASDCYEHLRNLDKAVEHSLLIQVADEEKAREEQYLAHLQRRTRISPANLWQTFDDNQVAGEKAFRGYAVSVLGEPASITRNDKGEVEVAFAVEAAGGTGVICVMDPKRERDAADLAKGKTALVAGSCVGMRDGVVILKECRLFTP